MGKREQDLLEAIWADPDARDPRVVYADYLQQQGDLRGEFMAIRLRWSEVDQKARNRALAIEKKHGGAWLGAARPFVRAKQYDFGGILVEVRCEADKFIAGFDALASLKHVAIEVTSVRNRKTVAQLAKLKLARVYELRIPTGIDDAGLAVLAPALGKCKRIAIGGTFANEGLRSLEPHVAKVEHIKFGRWTNEMKTGFFEGLAFSEIPQIASKLSFEQPAGARAYRC